MFKEMNLVLKNFRKIDIRIASCYPNVYKTAMSSLGYNIIYDMLNSREDSYCERVIYPSFKSLETNSPLIDFDVISFTIQYEEDYFNVLKMLKSANIPLKKDERDDSYPLIIAGGPCITANPIPMLDFIDLAIIGEAEAVFPEFFNKFYEIKDSSNKKRIFDELKEVNGVFREDEKNRIMIVKDMDEACHPTKFIVTKTDDKDLKPVFGDSILLGVSRGCSRGCRFCMSGYLYRPLRETSLKKLLDVCEKSRELTGFNKVSLVGASVSDYSKIDELSSNLLEMGFQISTPSLRIESITDEYLKNIAKSGIKSITLAPESTYNIRRSLNKNISDELLVDTIKNALKYDFNIKLYLLIGCPKEDLVELTKFINEISSLAKNIKFSVNPLIPKPHTPLQWNSFDLKSIKEKIKYIQKNSINKQIKFESPRMSLVQYVLSNKGREISPLIEKSAYRKVPIAEWKKYSKGYEISDELPWNNINSGLTDDFLKLEKENIEKKILRPWCETDGCYNCGAC